MKNKKKIGFDLKTHIRDAKGKVVRENAYRLVITNGVMEFERPKFSGDWYAADGTLIRTNKTKEQSPAQAPELDKSDLLQKIAELEAKNAELSQEDEAGEEIEEVVETALADIPVAAELDNSEELALIEAAKAQKPSKTSAFKAPNFIK